MSSPRLPRLAAPAVSALLLLAAGLLLADALLPALLPAPASPAPQPGWAYGDLRLVDPADAPEASQDLLAGYTRAVGSAWQIRLDLLDFAGSEPVDLYLALDFRPGGSRELPLDAETGLQWDILLHLPAAGPIQALDTGLRPLPDLGLSVLRDPIYDTLVVSLPYAGLPGELSPQSTFRLEVFTAGSGDSILADRLGPLSSGANPPQRAQVLVAFWNSLPAYSPRETLRRWDGAHTGPLGGRHGLYNLLRAVRNSRVPVFLLDLKYPTSLAALEFSGGGGLVADLAQAGLLGLPEALPGLLDAAGSPVFTRSQEALALAEKLSRQAADGFGFNSDSMLYAPEGAWPPTSAARVIFTPLPGEDGQNFTPLTLADCAGRTIVPLPTIPSTQPAPEQAALDGPSLELRRNLAAAAVSGQPDQFLLLGGDLPATTWGNPQIARATLRYLAEHPWIRVLGREDLPTLPAGAGCEMLPADRAVPPGFSAGLSGIDPQAGLASPALAAWLSLSAPTFPYHPDLPALRSAYSELTGWLERAEGWALHPGPQSFCQDQTCILASETGYAQFNTADGSLLLLFLRSPSGSLHQLSGPFAQFSSGQSDPFTWDLSAGARADPASPWGALGLPGGPVEVSLAAQEIRFTSPAGSRTYRLLADGLEVALASPGDFSYPLPLALDPWEIFRPGWVERYAQADTPGGWSWQLSSSRGERLALTLQTDAAVRASTFLDSYPRMSLPEDPNFDYPPGHGLPFPFAQVQLSGQDRATLRIQLSTQP